LFTGAIFIVFSPVVARLFTNGSIELSLNLRLAFCLLLVIQSVQLPIGYYLMQKTELFFQSMIVTLMATLNVTLSIHLARQLGSIGPLIASSISIFFLQIIPSMVYIKLKHSRRQQVVQETLYGGFDAR
jgi:hypothetical protein